MKKLVLSRELINSIANQENPKFIKSVNKKVNILLSNAIKKLSSQISYITLDNTILQPMNELFNGAFVDNSSFIYFLGINNAQLELNTARKTPFWKNFKQRLIYAWENRKKYKHKKKKKKKQEIEQKETEIKFDPNNYSIYNLAEDLQSALLEFLSETTLVYLKDNLLQIVGKEDFGSNTSIKIYIVNYNDELYKYYAGKKEGFKEINFKSRYDAINEKIKSVGENFVKILKVFNVTYFNANGYLPNQIFIESILCSCPEDLFYGEDIYKIFLKIINYLNIKNLKQIKSINNPLMTIFEDEICGNSALGFNKMLNSIIDQNDNEKLIKIKQKSKK